MGRRIKENCQECQNCQKSPKVEGKTLPRLTADERGSGTLLKSAQARVFCPIQAKTGLPPRQVKSAPSGDPCAPRRLDFEKVFSKSIVF
jgi:hypothetical protein